MDDGADPNAAAGRPPTRTNRSHGRAAAGPFTSGEAHPSNRGSIEPSHESLEEQPSRRHIRPLLPLGSYNLLHLLTGEAGSQSSRPRPSATRSQASSSTAPPSDDPGARRTGSGTRGRRSRRRRSTRHVEHPSGVGSSELEITNLPIVEALSASGSTGFHSHHPGTGRTGSRTRIRQSALYADHPRRSRHRISTRTEEHPRELDGAVTDLPTLEALSLSDPPPLTPEKTGEEIGDDNASDKLRSEIMESIDALPPMSFEEFFDSLLAVQHATLTALAAEKGIEPPRNPFFIDQEAMSLQAQQQDSAAAAHSQNSVAMSQEASTGVIKDGKKWMRDEVTLCFRKHVEKTPYLTGLVFELDELCHQCFHVESYQKVFHHYNFRIRMKIPASDCWTVELYFGEVKEIFGRKFYFCCPLEPNESGHCYACKNQGVEDLKHPVTGGFEIGLPDAPESNFWYSDGDE